MVPRNSILQGLPAGKYIQFIKYTKELEIYPIDSKKLLTSQSGKRVARVNIKITHIANLLLPLPTSQCNGPNCHLAVARNSGSLFTTTNFYKYWAYQISVYRLISNVGVTELLFTYNYI